MTCIGFSLSSIVRVEECESGEFCLLLFRPGGTENRIRLEMKGVSLASSFSHTPVTETLFILVIVASCRFSVVVQSYECIFTTKTQKSGAVLWYSVGA